MSSYWASVSCAPASISSAKPLCPAVKSTYVAVHVSPEVKFRVAKISLPALKYGTMPLPTDNSRMRCGTNRLLALSDSMVTVTVFVGRFAASVSSGSVRSNVWDRRFCQRGLLHR